MSSGGLQYYYRDLSVVIAFRMVPSVEGYMST